jgi:hypothetical protein
VVFVLPADCETATEKDRRWQWSATADSPEIPESRHNKFFAPPMSASLSGAPLRGFDAELKTLFRSACDASAPKCPEHALQE